MFTYLDMIAMSIGGVLLLVFIVAIKGKIDAGWLGAAWLSTISLAFFAPAVIYGLNLTASAHEIDNLVKLCPASKDAMDSMPQPITSRGITKIYNECKP